MSEPFPLFSKLLVGRFGSEWPGDGNDVQPGFELVAELRDERTESSSDQHTGHRVAETFGGDETHFRRFLILVPKDAQYEISSPEAFAFLPHAAKFATPLHASGFAQPHAGQSRHLS
ncbi:MAG: hypothetical protein AAGH89_02175 [Verrucomicrobiota bacterium]